MPKIKLTKGELKKQRDALKRYERYLPTLLLKKQQIQVEIIKQLATIEERNKTLAVDMRSALTWAGLLKEFDTSALIKLEEIRRETKNIAGVDIAIFRKAEFGEAEYDMFLAPLWVDNAVNALRAIIILREDIKMTEKNIEILRGELRITTQRVNLFEKVKIPEAVENIRRIRIYIGDQMANAVGRSKIAKRKIEEMEGAGAAI